MMLSDGWYFLVGYYFDSIRRRNGEKIGNIFEKSFILSLLVPFILSLIELKFENVLNDDYLKMTTALLTISIFGMVMKRYSDKSYNKWNKLIIFLGNLVFGVYLTEFFARAAFLPLYKYLINHVFGVVACCIYIIASIVLSFLFSYILSKIPKIKELI